MKVIFFITSFFSCKTTVIKVIVGEHIKTIEVTNVYDLGKLVALRFLEWVSAHPDGVIALPTGRTPEYFIKTLVS